MTLPTAAKIPARIFFQDTRATCWSQARWFRAGLQLSHIPGVTPLSPDCYTRHSQVALQPCPSLSRLLTHYWPADLPKVPLQNQARRELPRGKEPVVCNLGQLTAISSGRDGALGTHSHYCHWETDKKRAQMQKTSCTFKLHLWAS